MLNIFQKWLSTYSIKYPRSIVYMLQSSEYKLRGYFAWLVNIKSFKKVEVRKKFVPTKKALLLLSISWLIFVSTFVVSFYFLKSSEYILFFVMVILAPYILSFGIAIPLVLIKIFIQIPIQYFIVQKSKKKLKTHKAIKIGIAGSFGKTTMREILKTVLNEGKIVAAPPENHNTLLGISNFIKNLKGNEEVLIFELGEYYKGDIKEMCEFVHPDLGVITGVNEAHLEKFKSLEVTASTIFELADWLVDNPVYVNGENTLAKKHALEKHIVYTRDGIEEWKVINMKTDLSGTYFTVSRNMQNYDFHSNLLGLHQVGPLLLSIHLALRLGVSIENIQKGISKTKPFDHRLEPKVDKSGVITIDDSYNGNPDGVKVVIEFLAGLQGYRRFYVTPGLVEMGNKTETVHKQIGRQLAQANIEKVILIRNSVTPFIESGLREVGFKGEILWFESGLQAFSALPHLTAKDDVVLLQNDWPDQYY